MRFDFPHYESLNERAWRVRAAALYALVTVRWGDSVVATATLPTLTFTDGGQVFVFTK